MKLIYNGEVKNGKFHIFRRAEFLEDVLRMFNGKTVVISVEKKKKTRSLPQNSFYWGVVVPMVRQGLLDVGYRVSIEETHETLKEKFIRKEIVNEDTGEVLTEISKHTWELSTSEFMDYLAEIQQWAAEYLDIVIPDPGEELKIEFND